MAKSNKNWRSRTALTALASGLVMGATGTASAGPAIGQFELKSLGIEPGEFEFQSQNAYAIGNPRRRTLRNDDGELEADDNSLSRQRHALELEYNFTKVLKGRIGIEYEKERRDDPTTERNASGYDAIEPDEYETELIWVISPRRGDGFALGVVVEYEHPVESKGARSLAAGPILEYIQGPWYVNLNPTLVQSFGGDRNDAGQQDEKVDFGYAAQIKYRWSEQIDFALEAYGSIDRVCGRGAPSEEALLFGDFDQHRIGPVVYWTFEAQGVPRESEVSLGFGTLFGLNENTPSTTLKLSMELTF